MTCTQRRPFAAFALCLALGAASIAGAAHAATIPASSYSGLHWRNIGPFMGGRALTVSGVAGQPGHFYFGSTGGGVWESHDYGLNWKPVSDKDFKTGAVGALAVAPSDPNVIYAGMGEPEIRGDMATGDGLYKSNDGGKHWVQAGLKHTHVISRIIVDPRDASHVWVAAMGHVFGPNPERGIFETHDGGQHWKKTLFVDNKTGAIDLSVDPNNPRILYAAMWQASRRPWMLSSGGPGSGLYKSTDGGAHWTNISKRPGLPKGILGRIGVTVSGADSNRLYAIIEAKAGGVFRSDDAGKNWKRVYHKSHLTQRAWYFSRIFADPKDVNVVYAPEVEGVFKSTDGGKSFKPLHPPHGDVHALWIDPNHTNVMICGNDGGASVSQNGGVTWGPEDNQPTAQFYHIAIDHQFPFHVYGAQQDRGSVALASRSAGRDIGEESLHDIAGGESGFVVPVPGKPWITYAGGYDGALSRYNRRTDEVRAVDVWPDNVMGHAAADLKHRFQWTFPIVISHFAPHAIYVGSQYVMRSTNGGTSWEQISPDLTRDIKAKEASSGGPLTQDNTSVEYYGTVFALAESPLKQGLLWAGSDDGLVHVSQDGGKSWKDVTPSGLPKLTTISSIDPSHFDPATAYIAARRYRQDDFNPYLYVTHDYGQHWIKITNGLPNDESSFVIRQDTKDKRLLFAGTMSGIYVSFDHGVDWQPLQENLPHVPVRDIQVQPDVNALAIATHGRAFWVLDDLQPLREMSEKIARADKHLFTPQTAYLTYGGHQEDDDDAAVDAAGENPVNGVSVYYTLKHAPAKDEKISLTFATEAGQTIATFSNKTDANGKPLKKDKDFYAPKEEKQSGVVPTKEGMNRFVWKLREPDATKVPGAIIWFGSMRGPRIAPGHYKVTLTAGKTKETRDFEVRKDPRITASQADLEAQYLLLKKIHAKLDQTDRAILKLRKVRKQVKAYLKRLGKNAKDAAAIKTSAKALVAKLDAIEAKLIQTKSHSNEDPLNYPIRLNNKLAALATEIGRSFAHPTRQDEGVYTVLSSETNAQLQQLDDALGHQLPALNALIAQANVTAIAVPDKDSQD